MATESSDLNPETPLPYAPRPRTPRGPAAHILAAIRRSFREAFSRESIVSSLKSVLWVGPLTVLIWIYAEREQLWTSKAAVPIPVAVKSADPQVVIRILSPSSGRIEAFLQGPRAKVDQVQEDLQRRGDAGSLRIEVDRNLGFGHQQISATSVESDPEFSRNGISLSQLQPRLLEVFVDILQELEADVIVPSTLTNVTGVVFDVPRVHVSAPKTLMDGAPKPFTIVADITALPQSRIPGKHENIPVRLVMPFSDPNTRVTPSTVNVTFEVRQTSDERKFDSIPVLRAYPPGMDDKYRVVLTEESVPNVTVVGPADIVHAMAPPEAVLKVSLDDVPQGATERTLTRKPKIELPDGVKLKDAAQQITVEFKVVERES